MQVFLVLQQSIGDNDNIDDTNDAKLLDQRTIDYPYQKKTWQSRKYNTKSKRFLEIEMSRINHRTAIS